MSASGQMACPLASAAVERPDDAACISDACVWSYAELDRAVRSFEQWCEKFTPGDVLALRVPNAIPAIAMAWACFRRGLVLCPISTRVPDAQVDEILAQSGARCLVQADPSVRTPAVDSFRLSAIPVDLSFSAEDRSPPEISLERPGTILYTSGSSGEPKGVLHLLRAHVANATAANANMPLGPGDRWLLSLPLYHVGGLAIVFRCVLAGAAIVLPGSAATWIDALQRHAVTHVSVVGTQLRRLLDHGSAHGSVLKVVLLGGGPLDVELVRRARATHLPLRCTYGLTEMGSQVATEPGQGAPGPLGSSGRALSGQELRVTDRGEIDVRGDGRFEGYLTAGGLLRPFTQDGWYATGDCGRTDEDGNLWIHGRRDNMFVSGGENVHPEEVEGTIGRVLGITPVVVVPVADAEFGHRSVAFVAPSAVDALRDGLQTLREHLPGFKIPRTVLAWPEETEPRVDRRQLMDFAAAQLGS